MRSELIRYARSRDGVKIAWTMAGEGPATLVIAAGNITDIRRDWENPLRRDLLNALSRRFRVLRYDHRGCGLSQRDVARQGLEAWVDDLESVCDAAGLRSPFVLFAASQAGPHAITFAARNPRRVSHLALLGVCRCGPRASGDPVAKAQVEAMLELVRVGWGRTFPGARRLVTSFLVLDPTEEESRWDEDQLPLAATAEDAWRFFDADADADARPWVSEVRVPTLVVHAAEDSCIPPAIGRLVAGSIPGATYLEIPGRNHIPLARDPGFEALIEAILEFTDASSTAPAGLTAREVQILQGLVAGLSNEAIALRHGVSPKTVRNQLIRIFDKLQVNSRTQAALKASAWLRPHEDA